MPSHHQDYTLEGVGPCLRLVNADELLPVLTAAMPGWPLTPCAAQTQSPEICVWRHPQGYWQEAPALPEGALLDSAVGTACSVIADAAGAYFYRHPELVGLHCGSVEINGQLVIFPDTYRAGKSTLTAAFAAAGQRVFGDDVLALNKQGEGIALGVAPRLRLPLPDAMSLEFRQFVQTHLGPQDARYGYLRLDNTQLASHGQRCPLGAILLIDRDESLNEPQLTRLQPGDGLWQLLQQNFAEHESDQALIERFLPLLQGLPCFLLRYRDAFDAAQWLTKRWGSDTLESLAPASQPRGDTPDVIPALEPTDARQWQASEAAFEFPLGDELFVIAEEGGAIHRLNTTSRAVWALLNHEPLDLESVSDTLTGFFAGAKFEQVRQDVAQLLAQFHHAGLIKNVNA